MNRLAESAHQPHDFIDPARARDAPASSFCGTKIHCRVGGSAWYRRARVLTVVGGALINTSVTTRPAASRKEVFKRKCRQMHAEHADRDRLNDLSRCAIGCAFTVLNTLGAGFLEKVYENALAIELHAAGLGVVQQSAVSVHYNGKVVGEYFADLLVEDMLLIELKTVKALDDAHRMQCTNYLKASGLRLCLLLNFGKPRLEIKRVVHGL
jgi:GxxExxY protein